MTGMSSSSDGGLPQCRLCLRSGASCIYPLFSLKPGPKRQTRKSWFVEPSEGSVSLISFSKSDYFHDRFDQLEDPSSSGEGVIRRNTGQSSSGSETRPAEAQLPPFSHHQRPSSSKQHRHLSEPHDVQLATTSTQSTLSQIHLPDGPGNLQTTQQTLVDPPVPSHDIIIHLIEVYFASVHPQLRLLHRPNVLRWLYSGSCFTEEYSSLLLNAMFALATRYTDDPRVHSFDQYLAEKSSTGFFISSDAEGMKFSDRGKGFLRRASSLLQDEMTKIEKLGVEFSMATKTSLPLIQASILISYAVLTIGAVNRAYPLVSACLRMAYDAGLDQLDRIEYLQLLNMPTQRMESPQEMDWSKKEELRRAWWCLWEVESFLAAIRCQPRMLSTKKCRTKLPVDDVDWHEGNETSSSAFLPTNLDEWRILWKPPPATSLYANRMAALQFALTFVDLSNNEDPEELLRTCSELEQIATLWSQNLPPEYRPDARMQHVLQQSDSLNEVFTMYIASELVTILTAKAQMYQGIAATTALDYRGKYRRWLSSKDEEASCKTHTVAAKTKFFKALQASDTICAIVKDWPTRFIHRTCPFIVFGLWAPACIQLLVKASALDAWELRDEASLSLQAIISAMEQFAEYGGLGRAVLSSFRRYQSKMSEVKTNEPNNYEKDFVLEKRILSLPSDVDDVIIAAVRNKEKTSASTETPEADWHNPADPGTSLWSSESDHVHSLDIDPTTFPWDMLQDNDWMNATFG
ncbi:fungal-specific transcription factor domain-containing protein [Xylogone sp. PMI_703]|nr:fungal-specific transcription factor domain-containing protein [Xylogone sp. PMI_703]